MQIDIFSSSGCKKDQLMEWFDGRCTHWNCTCTQRSGVNSFQWNCYHQWICSEMMMQDCVLVNSGEPTRKPALLGNQLDGAELWRYKGNCRVQKGRELYYCSHDNTAFLFVCHWLVTPIYLLYHLVNCSNYDVGKVRSSDDVTNNVTISLSRWRWPRVRG